MKLIRYLAIGRKPGTPDFSNQGSVRMTMQRPSLKVGEIPLRLEIDVPNELFKRPALQASITVPADAVQAPTIEADVVDNIEDIIQRELGVDLTISVIDTEDT